MTNGILSLSILSSLLLQILFDLSKGKGFSGALKNTAGMRREEVQEHLRLVNYPFNFFKHADRDPDRMELFTALYIFEFPYHDYHSKSTVSWRSVSLTVSGSSRRLLERETSR